jgi:two-component system chemotaxis sensor kinase CheA
MLDETSMGTLLETFLAETSEGLDLAETALLALERDADDAEALGLAFRVVHTLKGNAGVFEFQALTAVAHAMEDLLEALRAGRARASHDVTSLLLEALDALRALLGDDDRTRPLDARERALVERLQAGTHGSSASSAAVSAAAHGNRLAARTLRIDVARLDRLLDLSGEIGVARGRLGQLLEEGTSSPRVLLEAHRDADALHLELQELVMKLRMVPVGPSFRQLHRLVRDAAQSAGRMAELRIEGGDVEVDMTIVEHLRDPLTHMVRNSIAHGIEPAEVRRMAGKPAAGQLRLRSFHDSGSIVVELEDDGAGIDRDRVVRRAIERGLVAEGQNLSETEVMDLLFRPGFSTAAGVTDLSGRGVGLDVVRRNIEAIHGSITVSSRPGRGTTFTLRLPLTLAIVDGLLVCVGGESFVIPMDSVVEALRFPAESDPAAATGVLTHRDETIPFLRLSHRLSRAGVSSVRENAVIVRFAAGRAALVVDRLHGECQNVVKPLPRAIRGVPGLSGSTILPNGTIAFIVDVFALLSAETGRSQPQLHPSKRISQEPSCPARN